MQQASDQDLDRPPGQVRPAHEAFEVFVREAEPRLRRALVAAYGFEEGRDAAAEALAVVLVHGYGYTLREVSELAGIRTTTVQNHLERGLARLRASLGVTDA
jgi:hypothetical protein